MGEGEGVFNIIILVDNGWSRLGGAEGGDCSDFDCGDSLLIVIFAALSGLEWGADVDDSGWLLGDTGAGDEAINHSLDFGSARMAKVHLYVPVHIVKAIIPVGRLGDTVYWFVFREVEVGIRPFLTGLGWCGDSDHAGK